MEGEDGDGAKLRMGIGLDVILVRVSDTLTLSIYSYILSRVQMEDDTGVNPTKSTEFEDDGSGSRAEFRLRFVFSTSDYVLFLYFVSVLP